MFVGMKKNRVDQDTIELQIRGCLHPKEKTREYNKQSPSTDAKKKARQRLAIINGH